MKKKEKKALLVLAEDIDTLRARVSDLERTVHEYGNALIHVLSILLAQEEE